MTYGSLFTGIGGIDLGLYRAGMTCKWQVEIDPFCQRVLAKHWPHVKRYGDIRTVGELEGVDLIAGGFPCQDISYAGAGAGIDGARSGLWGEMLRIIRLVRPQFVLVENVSALLTRGIERVLGELAASGYDAEWQSLPAAAFGAPHIRDRVFILAYSKSQSWLQSKAKVDPSTIGGQRGNGSIRGRENVACSQCPEWRPDPASRGRVAGIDGIPQGEEGQSWPRVGRKDVADAEEFSERKPANEAIAIADGGQTRDEPLCGGDLDGSGWWRIEPAVGGSLNGFSSWLDGFSGLIDSHKLFLAYGNATQERPDQALCSLRNKIGTPDVRQHLGRSGSISATEVLFAYLCKLQEASTNEARIQLACQETPEDRMRSMRLSIQPSGPSCRPGQQEQRAAQYPNSMQALSRLLAQHAEKAWLAYRRSDACPSLGWESGIARVAHGVPHRVDRLKGLGNAVVPQIAQWIGERILEVV